MKSAHWVWMLVCASALVAGGCGAPLKTWPAKSNLYPIALGNEWVYSDTGLTGALRSVRTRRIVGAGTFNGRPAWKMVERGGTAESPLDFMLWSDASGVHVHVADAYSRRDAERLDISYPLTVGQSWRSLMQINDGGHLRDMAWVFRVGGEEKVTVPAGTFLAVRVDSHTDLVDPDELVFIRTWYAPGVGPVMLQSGPNPGVFDSTWKLIRYKVK